MWVGRSFTVSSEPTSKDSTTTNSSFRVVDCFPFQRGCVTKTTSVIVSFPPGNQADSTSVSSPEASQISPISFSSPSRDRPGATAVPLLASGFLCGVSTSRTSDLECRRIPFEPNELDQLLAGSSFENVDIDRVAIVPLSVLLHMAVFNGDWVIQHTTHDVPRAYCTFLSCCSVHETLGRSISC